MATSDPDADLLGRSAALTSILAALDGARGGHGGFVLVRGEPGIGKSAIAAATARAAERAGAQVILGRAWELAEAPPYFPVWPCLRALGLKPPEGGGDVFRVWEEVLAALAQASAARPIVWLLEDLHAADLQTLDLLTFLAQPLGALHVLAIATARKQDPRITEGVAQRLVRLVRASREVELGALDPGDVARLAERTAGRTVSAATVRELVELTGGNPLFVVECARVLRAAGAAPARASALPQTVRQVIAERVALLPAGTQRVLEAAAIVGREASAATIGRILATLPANVIDAMLPAIEGGIVNEARPGHYVFTHILVRDAIEEGIVPSARAAHHARAEAALATAGDSVDIVVERARHALASMRDDGTAIALGDHAATLLERLGAFDRALAMHERVEEARHAGLGPRATPDARLHVAGIARLAGRHAEGRRICGEVLAAARAAGDADLLGRAALVLGAEIRPGTVDQELVAALEEARGMLLRAGRGAGAIGCRVLARLAAATQPAKNPEDPMRMAREAIGAARTLGDDGALLEVLSTALAAFIDYSPTEARALQAEVLERALTAGDDVKALRAQNLTALDLAAQGDFAGWQRAVERAQTLSLRIGDPRYRWRTLLIASMDGLLRGDVAASDGCEAEVRQLAALTDDPALNLGRWAHATEKARLLHRDEDLKQALPEVAAWLAHIPHASYVAGGLHAGIHARLEQREESIAALAAMLKDPVPDELDQITLAGAEASAFAGDVARCRAYHAFFLPHAALELTTGSISTTYAGPVSRILGLLESALGEHASAERRLRAALDVARARGHRPWVAQIAYDLARALDRAGTTTGVQEHLEEAARVAEDVGMPGLVRRARARLERSPPDAREPPLSAGAPRAGRLPTSLSMQREGDTWRVEHRGRVVRIKDSRGVQLLGRLVERPDEDIHVLALASDDAGASLADTGAGDAIDARALRAYKERLDDLATLLEEAERDADRGRTERLAREKSTIEAELRRVVGLSGKARAGSGSASERARVNVQRRLKDAISRIAEHDADLGRFLERAIRTGTFCRFSG